MIILGVDLGHARTGLSVCDKNELLASPLKVICQRDPEKLCREIAQAAEEAEALRQSRLASLEGISEEDLGKLANELGINPAECKDQADVLKKVKAALKK